MWGGDGRGWECYEMIIDYPSSNCCSESPSDTRVACRSQCTSGRTRVWLKTARGPRGRGWGTGRGGSGWGGAARTRMWGTSVF